MAKFETEMTNPVTGEKALLKSNDYYLLQSKIQKQKDKWIREHEKRLVQQTKQRGQESAEQQTLDAQDLIKQYENILNQTLDVNDRIDWEELKDKTVFSPFVFRTEPIESSFFLNVPKKSWLEMILPFLKTKRERMEEEAKKCFETSKSQYEKEKGEKKEAYEQEKTKFLASQEEHNRSIDHMKQSFESGDKATIEKYLNLVLERSSYPDTIELDHQMSFDSQSGLLILNTVMPTIEDLNLISEVKYVASRNDYQIKMVGKSESKAIFQKVIYQLALRTVHEIYEAEYFGHVQKVSFGGFVKGLDPRTGNDRKLQVIKFEIERDHFLTLNLHRIDPVKCLEDLGAYMEKSAYEIGKKEAA